MDGEGQGASLPSVSHIISQISFQTAAQGAAIGIEKMLHPSIALSPEKAVLIMDGCFQEGVFPVLFSPDHSAVAVPWDLQPDLPFEWALYEQPEATPRPIQRGRLITSYVILIKVKKQIWTPMAP